MQLLLVTCAHRPHNVGPTFTNCKRNVIFTCMAFSNLVNEVQEKIFDVLV